MIDTFIKFLKITDGIAASVFLLRTFVPSLLSCIVHEQIFQLP